VAVSRSIRVPLDWRTAAPPFRPPLAILVPSIDLIALAGAALVGSIHFVGLAYTVVAFAVLVVTGGDRARINPQLGADLPGLLGRLAVAALVVAPFAASDALTGRFIRVVPFAILLVLCGRALSYAIVRETRARGFILEPTLIIGAGHLGARLADTLMEHPQFGLAPVGFLDTFDPDESLPAPILGTPADLDDVVRRFGVQRVIVAFGGTREPDMVPVLRACDRLPVEVHVMPRFFELGVTRGGSFTDDLWGIPLIRLRRSVLRTAAWRTKRMFDLVAGTALLILTAPLFLASAAAVRLFGPGPVFFRQKRIGQRGQVFECLKFRTMEHVEDSDTAWVADEERYTRAGRILRRTGLDELPQLLNVLRGEMSLVGPRPERPYFVDQFRVAVPGYTDRHRVPVGITGWAQVHGLRGDTSIEERAVFDNNYVENWSVWLDLVILFRTLGAIIRGEDA
jgi:exopolysaccharide biosynthesis polyprenyl glycosylphosphotransferase